MAIPTLDQSRGYDIVIWVDDDGRVIAKAFTILGEVSFHGLLPDYQMGQEIMIDSVAQPEEFFGQMPKGIRIGMVNPATGGVWPTTGLASLN